MIQHGDLIDGMVGLILVHMQLLGGLLFMVTECLGLYLRKKDLYLSMALLAGYTFISGYATLRFGGSDELFLFSPIADFVKFFN